MEMYVWLERESGLHTANTPHFRLGSYLCAVMPAGDCVCHFKNKYYAAGYGGRHVDFLLDDGTTMRVHGPFEQHPYTLELPVLTRQCAVPHMAQQFLSLRATKLIVGERLNPFWNHHEVQRIVFQDTEWSVAPLADRYKPEWDQYEIAIVGRRRTRYMRPGELRELLERKFGDATPETK